jgi:Primase X
MTVSHSQKPTNTIKWIEKGILEHPLSDHRKYIIWRILSPYMLNVKKLPKEEDYSVMKEWLDKCSQLEKLNFNPKDGLKRASKGYYPISMEKLKEENRQLYDLVLDRIGTISKHFINNWRSKRITLSDFAFKWFMSNNLLTTEERQHKDEIVDLTEQVLNAKGLECDKRIRLWE